jgi:hypothetical protein
LTTDVVARNAVHAKAKLDFMAETAMVVAAPMREQEGVPVLLADLTAAEIIALGWSHMNSALNAWPEPIRALLICSADQDVDTTAGQFSTWDGIDDRGGAGEVNGQLAVQMADPANKHSPDGIGTWRGHDYLDLRNAPLCDIVNNNPPGCNWGSVPAGTMWNHYYHVKWDPAVTGNPSLANPKMRVALTWDAHVSCTNVTTQDAACTDDASHFIDADIDMYVYRHSNGQMVAHSTTSYSNWEFVEFVPEAGVDYDVKLFVASAWWAPYTYMGIAWNTATYATK